MLQRAGTNKLSIPREEQALQGSAGVGAPCRSGNRVIDITGTRAKPLEPRDAIGILVVDDTEMGTQLLIDSLRRDRHFQVVAATEDSVDAVESISGAKLEVALVGSSPDRGSLRGLELTRQLRNTYPEIRVVVLLDRSTQESVVEAFRAGAHGVFCRSGSLKALRKCIVCVHAGQVWATSKEMCYLLESLNEIRVRPLLDSKGFRLLSKREEDVLNCAVDGLKNREIAAQLHLSEHTIKNYMFRIFDKLGVSSRVEMILYALSQRSSCLSAWPGCELVRISDYEVNGKAS